MAQSSRELPPSHEPQAVHSRASSRARAPFAATIFATITALAIALPAAGDPLSTDMIPPDVTLSPNGASASTAAASSATAPGMATSQAGGGTPGQAGTASPPPPPSGSSAYFQGWKGVTPGHKGLSPAGAQPGQPPPPQVDAKNDPLAIIETDRGDITIRLFRQLAPKTVAAFIQMVNEGFYNGLTFHRKEPGFVIQGGDPKGNGSGFYIDPKTNKPRMLFLETSPYLKHNAPGVVAMARFPKNPHSASCQFYITLAPQPRLDGKYSIFGGVVKGMDVVNRIEIGDKMQVVRIVQPGG